MKNLKRGLRITVSFAIAGILLWLFFRKLDMREIFSHMKEADGVWLAGAVGFQGLHLMFRSLRWRILMTPIKPRIGFYNLFSTTAIGYLLSFVLFRIGEVLRPIMLAQRESVSRSATLATCVLERLMDFLTVAMLFGFYLIFLFQPPAGGTGSLDFERIRTVGLVFGALTLASFPAMYVVVHYRHRLYAYWERRSGGTNALLPRLLHSFLGGFDVVKGGRVFTLAWVQSAATWLAINGSVWASLKAFHLDVGFGDSLLMLALLTFGIAIPTPGAVGSYEYLGQLGLVEFFGVEPNRAAATILVTHAFAIAPVIIIGIVLLWKDGLSLRSLSRISEEADGMPRVAGAAR